MLDAAVYPHIFDVIFADSDFDTLLTFRATSRSMCERADAILFRHVAVDFSHSEIILRRPQAPNHRLPLPRIPLIGRPLPWDDYIALMNRWHRALAFARIADLHGSRDPPGHSEMDTRVRANFASITIPLVRDLRVEPTPCPFEATEWHTYMWRRVDGCPPMPATQTERVVIHMPHNVDLGFLLAFGFEDDWHRAARSPWPRRDRGDEARHVAFVFHGEGWNWRAGRNLLRQSVGRFVLAVRETLQDSDARISFVGWETLSADEVEAMYLNHFETVPDGEGPVAVRTFLHEIESDHGTLPQFAGKPWRRRIGWCTADEWREASAFPEVALKCPPKLDRGPPPPRADAGGASHATMGENPTSEAGIPGRFTTVRTRLAALVGSVARNLF